MYTTINKIVPISNGSETVIGGLSHIEPRVDYQKSQHSSDMHCTCRVTIDVIQVFILETRPTILLVEHVSERHFLTPTSLDTWIFSSYVIFWYDSFCVSSERYCFRYINENRSFQWISVIMIRTYVQILLKNLTLKKTWRNFSKKIFWFYV